MLGLGSLILDSRGLFPDREEGTIPFFCNSSSICLRLSSWWMEREEIEEYEKKDII